MKLLPMRINKSDKPIQGPYWITPKIEGYRILFNERQALNSKGKPVKNYLLRNMAGVLDSEYHQPLDCVVKFDSDKDPVLLVNSNNDEFNFTIYVIDLPNSRDCPLHERRESVRETSYELMSNVIASITPVAWFIDNGSPPPGDWWVRTYSEYVNGVYRNNKFFEIKGEVCVSN